MKRSVLALAGAAAILGVLGPPLAAQTSRGVVVQACDEYGSLKERLGEQFKEVPAAFGLGMNGNLIQVFVSAETGTWTIISTAPTGVSCIVAAGESWEILPDPSDSPFA